MSAREDGCRLHPSVTLSRPVARMFTALAAVTTFLIALLCSVSATAAGPPAPLGVTTRCVVIGVVAAAVVAAVFIRLSKLLNASPGSGCLCAEVVASGPASQPRPQLSPKPWMQRLPTLRETDYGSAGVVVVREPHPVDQFCGGGKDLRVSDMPRGDQRCVCRAIDLDQAGR